MIFIATLSGTPRRAIVEETLLPNASVSRVARRHDVNANQVFHWRKLYRRSCLRVGGFAAYVAIHYFLLSAQVARTLTARGPALRQAIVRLFTTIF